MLSAYGRSDSKACEASRLEVGLPGKVLGYFHVASLDPDQRSGLAGSRPVKLAPKQCLALESDHPHALLCTFFDQAKLIRVNIFRLTWTTGIHGEDESRHQC